MTDIAECFKKAYEIFKGQQGHIAEDLEKSLSADNEKNLIKHYWDLQESFKKGFYAELRKVMK